jgi:predicted lysophospholipase L1 biosynthesis ABC-type transport system permease subunit
VNALEIVIVVVVLLIIVLVVGGIVASGRRQRADDPALRRELDAANEALALAHATDKGWERSLLEEACRAAFAERSGAEIRELQLVQVVDKPGTEDDQAVFRVVTEHGSEHLHLDRRGDSWVAR